MQYTAIKLVIQPQVRITPELFETVRLETPELEDRQILLKQTHMSLDPAMKSWTTETLHPAGAVLMGRSPIANTLPG